MYLTLKLLHIVAVVLFLGNITTGVFWKAHADRTRDPRLIAHSLEGIIRSDRLFTVPGVLFIVLFGIAAAMTGRLPILRTPWILWSIILLIVAGVAFMTQLGPLQRRMLELMRHVPADAEPDWATYQTLSRRWAIWGAIALVTPFAAVALMVFKPT